MNLKIKREMKNGKNKMVIRVNLHDIIKIIEEEAVNQHPILKKCNPSKYLVEHNDDKMNFSIIDFTENSKGRRKASDNFDLVIEANIPRTLKKTKEDEWKLVNGKITVKELCDNSKYQWLWVRLGIKSLIKQDYDFFDLYIEKNDKQFYIGNLFSEDILTIDENKYIITKIYTKNSDLTTDLPNYLKTN